MFKDIRNFSVMQRQCATCPFRNNAKGRQTDSKLVAEIQQRCLTEASQTCHHPRLKGRQETHLCRGARDYQLQIFYRLGILEEPTDRCWSETHSGIEVKQLP